MLKFGDEIVTESGESPNLMLNLGTYLEDIFGTSPNLVMNQFLYKFTTLSTLIHFTTHLLLSATETTIMYSRVSVFLAF